MTIQRFKTAVAVAFLLTLVFAVSVAAEQVDVNFQMIATASGLSLHKEMFMMPLTYSNYYNGNESEAVFQMSAKHCIFDTRFYFAYTQISFWQAYDHYNSAPFRETNYNPELFYRTKTMPLYKGRLGADLGFEHESNGQRVPISRSWNLLYASPYYYTEDLLVYLKLRYRIPEDDKKSPEDAVGDDNPDITDFYGHADLNVYYRLGRGHAVHLMVRGNLSEGRGGLVFTYSLPVPMSDRSFIGIRVSQGYGESLVDYNRPLTRVGIGIMFTR